MVWPKKLTKSSIAAKKMMIETMWSMDTLDVSYPPLAAE
jgi:hypothetical protein